MISILDLLIIIFFAVFAINGYRKGFAIGVFHFGSTVISLVISALLYPVVTNFLMAMPFKEKIYTHILNNFLIADTDPFSLNSLPYFIRSSISNGISATLESTAAGLTKIVIMIISLLVIFVCVKVLMFFLIKTLQTIVRLPLLNTANKISGLLLGCLNGYIIITLIFALSSVFLAHNLVDYINSSNLGAFLYKNNFVLQLIIK